MSHMYDGYGRANPCYKRINYKANKCICIDVLNVRVCLKVESDM